MSKQEITGEEILDKLPPLKEKRKIYASYGHTYEANWLLALGFSLTSNIDNADVVVFGGGKDVDPGWYNEKKGRYTCTPTDRDKREREDFERVQDYRKMGREILSVGVCRGAQLGCVLSGGKLIQDVSNHTMSHTISTYDKQEYYVNSLHHQMLYPYNKDMDRKNYKILAWSTKNVSGRYLDGWDKSIWTPEGFKEIEIAYFINTNFLAIQSHPEMMYRDQRYDSVLKWMQDLFLKYYEKGE